MWSIFDHMRACGNTNGSKMSSVIAFCRLSVNGLLSARKGRPSVKSVRRFTLFLHLSHSIGRCCAPSLSLSLFLSLSLSLSLLSESWWIFQLSSLQNSDPFIRALRRRSQTYHPSPLLGSLAGRLHSACGPPSILWLGAPYRRNRINTYRGRRRRRRRRRRVTPSKHVSRRRRYRNVMSSSLRFHSPKAAATFVRGRSPSRLCFN